MKSIKKKVENKINTVEGTITIIHTIHHHPTAQKKSLPPSALCLSDSSLENRSSRHWNGGKMSGCETDRLKPKCVFGVVFRW